MTDVAFEWTAESKRANSDGLLGNRSRLRLTVLAALFLLAAGVRLYDLSAPGVLVDRDYTSAIFARDFYFQHAENIEPWRREIAQVMRANQPTLEPPVTEWLVSAIYRLLGTEDMRYARALTSSFWLIGGCFLYLSTKRLVSTDAAVFAVAYYLLLPHSILLSRSFQADSLMMLGFLASLYLIVRYHDAPTTRTIIVAALVAALTLVYRPLVLFALVGGFVLPMMQREGILRGAFNRSTLVYVSLAVLPAVLYYGYATFVARHFGWKLASSFRFHLFAEREYWIGWFNLALLVLGLAPLLLAAYGTVLLRNGLARSLILGLAIGYFAFGLLFTMHIHTHEYYHAQLVPVVAIAASPVVALLVQWFAAAPGRAIKWVALIAMTGIVATHSVLEWHRGLRRAHNEPADTARAIGQLVNHSKHVVFLSPYYGLSLQFLGEFTGAYWPRSITYRLYRHKGERELSIAERLATIPFAPDYFVITAFPEFERHHTDLSAYLENNCSLKARNPAYLIYEACKLPEATASQ